MDNFMENLLIILHMRSRYVPGLLPHREGPGEKAKYRIAGNFRMVLIFAYFVCTFCMRK